ncbi:MAG TPA: hypothetical protein VFR97_13385 [Capillimicrobium sp.]|nr:hypothetical protein [Capillimicrobium sp.]
MLRPLAGAFTAALLLAPAVAHGETLSLTARTTYVNVDPGSDGTVRIAGVDTPAGCDPDDGSGYVTCPMPTAISITLGAGDDVASVSSGLPAGLAVELDGAGGADTLRAPREGGATVTLEGGDGADELFGGDGDDTLRGGAGDDELNARGGDDVVSGGEGDDQLEPDEYDGPGDDVVDGGPGFDAVEDWSDPTDTFHAPVTVTQDGRPNDGRPGEHDNVTSVEKIVSHVSGTFGGTAADDELWIWANLDQKGSELLGLGGNDLLIGRNLDDRIDGGPGDDIIEGGNGDDTLVGGPGRDSIVGDSTESTCGVLQSCETPFGNDTIKVRDGARDSVSCGVGRDEVLADRADRVAPDCERVRRR